MYLKWFSKNNQKLKELQLKFHFFILQYLINYPFSIHAKQSNKVVSLLGFYALHILQQFSPILWQFPYQNIFYLLRYEYFHHSIYNINSICPILCPSSETSNPLTNLLNSICVFFAKYRKLFFPYQFFSHTAQTFWSNS